MDANQKQSNPPEKTNLDTVVVDKLRHRILTGTLASGTHISEQQVCKEYGVSRTPVREALCALAADGLIEMVPNRGAFVTSPSHETIKENRILYGHLKALTARQALSNSAQIDFSQLEYCLEEMRAPGTFFEEHRQRFHNTLEAGADMPALTDMLTFLSRRLPQPVLPPVALDNEAAMVTQGYRYLIAALKRNKPDVAERALRDVMALNFSVTPAETRPAQNSEQKATMVNKKRECG